MFQAEPTNLSQSCCLQCFDVGLGIEYTKGEILLVFRCHDVTEQTVVNMSTALCETPKNHKYISIITSGVYFMPRTIFLLSFPQMSRNILLRRGTPGCLHICSLDKHLKRDRPSSSMVMINNLHSV